MGIKKFFIQTRSDESEEFSTLTVSNNYMGASQDTPEVTYVAIDTCYPERASTTETWKDTKTYCDGKNMTLYAPKTKDELESMLECNNLHNGASQVWSGYK